MECEAEGENPAQSHHVVVRAGVVGLLRLLLCPELRWLMLTSLAVAGRDTVVVVN